ncbi:PEROXIDASE 56 [Salix purpurea]|uniref:peroxidase n=1 Tax=Salix purpurea TaxID=77065 RepID=A0A9Q0WHA8_SALPP|nr:PEROXIDASE 56 [Salix purpurea]
MGSLKLSSGSIFIRLVLLLFVFNSANAQLKGCDASILLNSSTGQAEKDSPPNLSVRGYQVIDRVKAALEKTCPGVVSCADILAIVARDVTVSTLGPSWRVETGRRDGRVSNFSEAITNLPPFFANISHLLTQFRSKNLSKKDLANVVNVKITYNEYPST